MFDSDSNEYLLIIGAGEKQIINCWVDLGYTN